MLRTEVKANRWIKLFNEPKLGELQFQYNIAGDTRQDSQVPV